MSPSIKPTTTFPFTNHPVQFVQGVFIESYDPTIEDSYRKTCEIDSRPCTLEILDTAGVEQFTAMRELYIKNGQGFVLVYSVANENSLKELLELREQVIRIKDNPNVPIVLVANKADLEAERQVTPEFGVRVANSWGRTPFYETSAKYRSNIDEVFTDLVRQIMRRDSVFGGGSSLGSHSLQNSIDDTNYTTSKHQKRGSNVSNYSSTNSVVQTPTTSIFKFKSRPQSKDLTAHQLSPKEEQQLKMIENSNFLSMDPNEGSGSHKSLHKKVSRAFKSPPAASKSMPMLRKKKGSVSSSGKDKDCVICWGIAYLPNMHPYIQSPECVPGLLDSLQE